LQYIKPPTVELKQLQLGGFIMSKGKREYTPVAELEEEIVRLKEQGKRERKLLLFSIIYSTSKAAGLIQNGC